MMDLLDCSAFKDVRFGFSTGVDGAKADAVDTMARMIDCFIVSFRGVVMVEKCQPFDLDYILHSFGLTSW